MAGLSPIRRPSHEERVCGRVRRTAAPVDKSVKGLHHVSEINGKQPATSGSGLAQVAEFELAVGDLPVAVMPS